MYMGTFHCAIPIAKFESCGVKLCNEQFSLGQGLRETVHCKISMAKMTGWLLELRSAQFNPA